MDRAVGRKMHLIFLAHLWACAPFMLVWLSVPRVRQEIGEPNLTHVAGFLPVVAVYVAVRTWLAFKDPPRLNWMVVFPPIDAAIVSVLVWLGNRDPLSNITLLYMFPLAEAASSLSLAWAASVAGMVLVGTGLATHGFQTTDPFNTVFRYFFLFVLTLLISGLTRMAAALREQLGVARDRNRIAMEMHDGVQGHLVTLSAQMELLEHVAAKDPERAARIAVEGREGARLAADELRFLVQRFRAPGLSEGFVPALQTFAHNQTSRNGLDLEFGAFGESRALWPWAENALFRIAQEAINNVLRHAKASKVWVEIEFGHEGVTLTVRDDGIGFDPASVSTEGGHAGLEGLQTRAAALGGKVNVESESGRGTTVKAFLPRPRETRSGRKQDG